MKVKELVVDSVCCCIRVRQQVGFGGSCLAWKRDIDSNSRWFFRRKLGLIVRHMSSQLVSDAIMIMITRTRRTIDQY